jgi:peptidoglycan/LPS O-acetylase OafA/YrhL
MIVGVVAVLGRGRFWNWSNKQPDRPYAILVAGAVILAALPAMLPVAQPHYWAQTAPLFAVLIVEHWRRKKTASPSMPLIGWAVVALFAYVATGLTLWQPLQNHGPTTLVMLALVAAGFVVLGRALPTERQAEASSAPASANAT